MGLQKSLKDLGVYRWVLLLHCHDVVRVAVGGEHGVHDVASPDLEHDIKSLDHL